MTLANLNEKKRKKAKTKILNTKRKTWILSEITKITLKHMQTDLNRQIKWINIRK